MTDETELSPTERQLRDALARLVAKRPTHRELKQKFKVNKLRITVSSVEKEAGLSNGVVKPERYPKLKEDILSAEAARKYGSVKDVSDEAVRRHPLYIKAKNDLDKAKAEMKILRAELMSKNSKLDSYKGRIKEQAVRMHQMNVAMWGQIPDEKKHVELMIDVQDMGMNSNVLDFKKREKLD